MAIEPKLVIKQAPTLIMTPALQQAIKLLPLARLELIQTIREELTENPLLEEASILQEEANADQEEEISSKDDKKDDTAPEIDWESYIQNSIDEKGAVGDYSEPPPIENKISRKTSLAEHLEWQLILSAKTELEKEGCNTKKYTIYATNGKFSIVLLFNIFLTIPNPFRQAFFSLPVRTNERKKIIFSACSRFQNNPDPLMRKLITRRMALSTLPLPVGRPLSRNVLY